MEGRTDGRTDRRIVAKDENNLPRASLKLSLGGGGGRREGGSGGIGIVLRFPLPNRMLFPTDLKEGVKGKGSRKVFTRNVRSKRISLAPDRLALRYAGDCVKR